MSAGTLTLTNNSSSVTGTGSSFTTELGTSDFIVVTVGGVTYTLPVKSVESDTVLTLEKAYAGPTQSGNAWSAMPRAAQNLVTAELVAQTTQALRGQNADKANWQAVFSSSGDITVVLPDGSIFSGPSWNSLSSSVSGKASAGVNSDITELKNLKTPLTILQGGTGSTTASGARGNLGLGSAALAAAQASVFDDTPGSLMQVGAFGLGSGRSSYGTPSGHGAGCCFIGGSSLPWMPGGAGIQASYDSARTGQLVIRPNNSVIFRWIQTDPETDYSTAPWTTLQNAGTSDIAAKEVTGELDVNESLKKVMAMDFVKFSYKSDERKKERRGVIAQQVINIDPEYVHDNEGTFKSLDLNPLMMDALAAIKALNAKIDALYEEIAALKGS